MNRIVGAFSLAMILVYSTADGRVLDPRLVPGLVRADSIRGHDVASLIYTYRGQADSIALRDLVVVGPVHVPPLQTSAKIFVHRTRFSGTVVLDSLHATSRWHITESTLTQDASFNWALFAGGLQLTGSEFVQSSSFWGTVFDGPLTADETHFGGEARFIKAEINSGALFRESTFGSRALFMDANLDVGERYSATIINAHFYGPVAFDRVRFLGKTTVASTFESNVQFGGALFDAWVGLENSVFTDSIGFNGAVRTRPIGITWPSIEGRVAYSEEAYGFLLTSFLANNDFESHDDCLYDFRVRKRAADHGRWSILRAAEWLLVDATCGYGLKPVRVLPTSLVVIVLFAVLYRRCVPSIDRADAFLLSSALFTGISSMGPSQQLGKRLRIAAGVEGLLGWFLMGLFVVTLAKVLIR